MSDTSACPKCGSENKMGRIYGYMCPHHYDGVSEWQCLDCGTRWGRWSGRILENYKWEPRYGVEVKR